MKANIVCLSVISLILVGCSSTGSRTKYGTLIRASFSPGIYETPHDSYSFASFNRAEMMTFLDSLPKEEFSNGDIVEVDGLKWQKNVCETKAVTTTRWILHNPKAWQSHHQGIRSSKYRKAEEAVQQLDSSTYEKGDVVEVAGFSWRKSVSHVPADSWIEWVPYPNPPVPQLEKGESKAKHTQEYAKWIQDHPHFGYPPIPLDSVSMSAPTGN